MHAETYRRDGDQYVFDKPGSNEVQFFQEADVAGIIEGDPSEGGSGSNLVERRQSKTALRFFASEIQI
jgi:hypothetical protein